MTNIEQSIEALIFTSEQGIRIEEILFCLQSALNADIEELEAEEILNKIRERYSHNQGAIELVKINNGYQFLTKKEYHPVVHQLQVQRSKRKLSQAALETLAIIAYRQPVTKIEIEQIRGVNCDYTIQKLLEKELIVIAGKAETIGKPTLYGTSAQFADYMGINSNNDLPRFGDMNNDNQIGIQSE